ncbi:MAG: hypothetical protein VX643_00095 [Chloroflexota bacterium]|nr:hypothetical protein [Chloroflexota bacterium]
MRGSIDCRTLQISLIDMRLPPFTAVLRFSFYLLMAMGLFIVGTSDYRPSYVDRVIAPFKYSLLEWELGHISDKWIYRLKDSVFGYPSADRRTSLVEVREYFELGKTLNHLRPSVIDNQVEIPHVLSNERKVDSKTEALKLIQNKREILKDRVEETIENEIWEVLRSLQLSSTIGIWPPVDVVFSGAPHVLVISPRDEIALKYTALLTYGLTPGQKSYIEDKVGLLENHSVIVEDLGGVAVYPSVVSEQLGIRRSLVVAAHEWLHHWFFFKPLGQRFWTSNEMTILNETVATIAGEEIGRLVYSRINQEMDDGSSSLAAGVPETSYNQSFDTVMRETRKQVGALLSEGRIEEAEDYMAQRVLLFRENGYYIRKLNQAYFAFHGMYGTSAASASPIGEQVRLLRSETSSLQEFLRLVSSFKDYEEFVRHLESLDQNDQS